MTKVKKSNFEYQFNGIVKKIHDFLFDMPCKFGEKHKIHFNFASSFMDFYDCACSIDSVHAHDFYQLYGLPQKLNDMYEYIAQVVVQS